MIEGRNVGGGKRGKRTSRQKSARFLGRGGQRFGRSRSRRKVQKFPERMGPNVPAGTRFREGEKARSGATNAGGLCVS